MENFLEEIWGYFGVISKRDSHRDSETGLFIIINLKIWDSEHSLVNKNWEKILVKISKKKKKKKVTSS